MFFSMIERLKIAYIIEMTEGCIRIQHTDKNVTKHAKKWLELLNVVYWLENIWNYANTFFQNDKSFD